MAADSARSDRRKRESAEGVRLTAEALEHLPPRVWDVFHDVHWPGSRLGKIDHIVVGPSGVFVIDSKNWPGEIAVRRGVLRQNGRRRDAAVVAATEAAFAVAQLLPDISPTHVTGVLCFASVDHTITTPRGVAIRERQDIVYRDNPPADAKPAAAPAAKAAPPKASHSESHLADPVLLFRYSALTFNGHRIHYDRDYVTKVEGYPGLIFHGPMQAALLVEFAAHLHGGTAPQRFSYRGLQPLFEGGEFSVNANEIAEGLDIWVANADGAPTMRGTASW